jgi:flavorubredoxin
MALIETVEPSEGAQLSAQLDEVGPIDLVTLDEGKLAMTPIDAATVVFGTPTVSGGPHPRVATVGGLVNDLKPKTRFISVIGSFGWSTTVDFDVALPRFPRARGVVASAIFLRRSKD